MSSLLPVPSVTFALFACSFCTPVLSQEASPAANRLVAYVAAVSDYPGNSAMYESLTNAERISEAISALGFKVTSLFDFTKDEFESSFQGWCKEAATAEVAIVYLCGHGGNQNGENFLFPIGTDTSALSQLPEQCIGIRKLLETLTKDQKKHQRVNLVAIDGSRENPFLSRAFGFEDVSSNASAFYSLPYLPSDTIVIYPTGSGELLARKDSSILADTLIEHVLRDNIDLSKGLESLRRVIHEKSGGYLDPTISIEFQGNLTFRGNGAQTALRFAGMANSGEERFLELRRQAQDAFAKDRFELAIKNLLEICREIPAKKDIAIGDLKSILTSSKFEDPYVGRLLMESSEFEFDSLGTSSGSGLDLKEARMLTWSSGQWFTEHWDVALSAAEYDAKKGLPEAMRICGELSLKKGRSSEDAKNLKVAEDWFLKAAEWFKKGAAQGDLKSIVWLGQLHMMGRGLPKDFDQAEKRFSAVRKMGDPRGAAGLGALELAKLNDKNKANLGNADLKDFDPAIDFFREAHEGTFYKYSYLLGTLLWMSSEDKKLSKKEATAIRGEAVQVLLTGAEQGIDSNCMWRLVKLSKYLEKSLVDLDVEIGKGDASAVSIRANTIEIQKELLALVPNDRQSELVALAADLGSGDAIQVARADQIDYFDSAKPLCEKWNVNYRLWKFDQEKANSLLAKPKS